MKNDDSFLNIITSVLGVFDRLQSGTPDMFELLKPLFKQLAYDGAAVYIADEYPDRMHLEAVYGDASMYPPLVVRNGRDSLHTCLEKMLVSVPDAISGQLFSHGRELGALVATGKHLDRKIARESFGVLVQSMAVMAYIERIRTNVVRERQERDIFFAQSLTSRLLVGTPPRVENLRIGVEFRRSLEVGGEFYDFVAVSPTRLRGFFGCCNGNGVRTALGVCRIMREVHRAAQMSDSPAAILLHVNNMLVEQKKRMRQTSLCVFDIDVDAGAVRLARAGHPGLLLCGPGTGIQDIPVATGPFLGTEPKPEIRDETFDFGPGRSLFCVTEKFNAMRNRANARPFRRFRAALENSLGGKKKTPLVNRVFHFIDQTTDQVENSPDALVALSVENMGE